MIIGGVEKLTLIDFPGKLAAIVFTQGCNFRCPFCYNPMLVWPIEVSKSKYRKDHSAIPRSDLFGFLESRRGKLDGVVITGGEPTLHPDLPDFLADIKALGFAIKLDTNGTNPELLEKIIRANLIDYLAMDIKAPLDKYAKVVGVEVDGPSIERSIGIIKSSGLPYEFRTTLVPGLHEADDVARMGPLVEGADKWYLQFFKSDTPLVDRKLETKGRFTFAQMQEMATEGGRWAKLCTIRGE